MTQEGSLDECAVWEGIGDGRCKAARPRLFSASGYYGNRDLERRDAAPRSASGGLTKDLGLDGRTAPKRNRAARGGREPAIDVSPEGFGIELIERRL